MLPSFISQESHPDFLQPNLLTGPRPVTRLGEDEGSWIIEQRDKLIPSAL